MTIDEAYTEWKKTAGLGILCSYGGLTGGPGYLGFGECKHPDHKDVRYGCSLCPKNCPDFKGDDSTQFQIFLSLYRHNPICFNEMYNIDRNSAGYICVDNPSPDDILRRDAEDLAVFNNAFGSQFLDIIPESPEDFD
jgi:hypothetical protein